MRRCSGEELERVDDGPCFDYLRTSSWALFVFLFELWPAIPVIGVFGPVLNAYCCGVITEPMAWRDVVSLIVLMCYWLSFFSTAFGTLLICKFGMLVLLKDCFFIARFFDCCRFALFKFCWASSILEACWFVLLCCIRFAFVIVWYMFLLLLGALDFTLAFSPGFVDISLVWVLPRLLVRVWRSFIW